MQLLIFWAARAGRKEYGKESEMSGLTYILGTDVC